MIVRARQKPIDQLPAWALCCDAIREVYRSQGGSLEVEVIPEAFVAEVECRFCHKTTENVQYMRVVTSPGAAEQGAIPVECFEFDEGPIQ